MTQENSLFEPDIYSATRSHRSYFDRARGTKESIHQARAIYEALRPIKPKSHADDYKEVWFTVGRGQIDDWMSFEDYRDVAWDEKADPSKNDWLEEWKDWFPNEEYWHLLACRKDNGWLTISVDNTVLIEASLEEDEYDPYVDEELILVLKGLVSVAQEVVEELRSGLYRSRIEKELPLKYRYGLIKRSNLWKTADTWYRFGNPDVEEEELYVLTDMLYSQPDKEDIDRAKSLSTGVYFEKLKQAYRFCGHENDRDWIGGISSNDGRAWYARFGDARDTSLLELDPASSESFKTWYLEKENHLDHNFEIFAGRGCTRVHLNPVLDSKGWYLAMWGSITWHAVDMARIARYMNDAGLPTYVYSADKIAKCLTGDDYVLIVPDHKPIDYVSGEYFGQEIVTAIHLPADAPEVFLQYIEWQEIELAQLL